MLFCDRDAQYRHVGLQVARRHRQCSPVDFNQLGVGAPVSEETVEKLHVPLPRN